MDADTTIALPCISIKFHNVLYSRAMTAKEYAKKFASRSGSYFMLKLARSAAQNSS